MRATKATAGEASAWLESSFQSSRGHSIPRCVIYAQYQEHCRSSGAIPPHQQKRPICAATFGKLVRRGFPGVSTRRLGTRGHSRYHYYGIRRRNGCGQDGSKDVASSSQALGAITAPPGFIDAFGDDARVVCIMYKTHCQCLVDTIVNGMSVVHFTKFTMAGQWS